MKTMKEAIAQAIKDGATEVTNAIVKHCYIKEHAEWTSASLKLNKVVKQNIADADDNYSIQDGNTVFVATGSIGACLNEMPELVLFKRMIMANPEVLETILSYSKINVLQYVVPKDVTHINPFNEKETDTKDHEWIASYITSIELGEEGAEFVNELRAEHRKMLRAKLLASVTTNAMRGKSIFAESNDTEA